MFVMFANGSSSTFLRFNLLIMLIIIINFKITQLKEKYKLFKFSLIS